MGAVMELIPRITKLFIDGLKPIAEKTQEVAKKTSGRKEGLYRYVTGTGDWSSNHIRMFDYLDSRHPCCGHIPAGNQFLPLASLAGMFYVFVMVSALY